MRMDVEVRGGQRVLKVVTGMRPKRQLVKIVREVTSRSREYVASINPVDTGAMRDSWTWTAMGLAGKAYTSLSAHNPRSGAPVSSYAGYVDDRVGLMDSMVIGAKRIAVEELDDIKWR